MKVKTKSRTNGFPLNSLEGITWLYFKGREEEIWKQVSNEVLEIEEYKIESHLILQIYLEGPNDDGRFEKKIELNGKELEVKLMFLRKNGTQWLPYEVSRKLKGGLDPRFRMYPDSRTVDPAEGYSNPRLKNHCSECGQETTEFWVAITEVGLVPKIVIAGTILHCGHLQVKWTRV